MDINGLVNMVSALKSDDKNLREFQSGPVAFIEKFLGVDLSALIGKIASAKLDVNGDGKIDINDASNFLGDLLGGGENGENKGLNLGSLLKTFKI